jgi:hypothetical protein
MTLKSALDISSAAVLLADACHGQCRSIIGYLQGCCSSAMVCALPTVPAKSWCPHHHALYYRERGSVSDFKRWERRVLSAPSSRNGRRA